jgi:hypothetical protein
MARFFRIHWIVGILVLSCWLPIADAQAKRRNYGDGPPDAGALFEGRGQASDEASYATRGLYRYQYFPEAQVYYDPSRELFFYNHRGEWIKSPALPREFRNRLGDFVIVELNDDDPLRHHQGSITHQARPEEFQEEPDRFKTSAEPAPSPKYRQFHYYHQYQTYFDPIKNIYYHFRDGRWVKSFNPPRSLRTYTDDYVIIETDTETPYIYHEQVLHMFFKHATESSHMKTARPNWEPRSNERAFRYWYYPTASVYYDQDRRIYFYYDHDQWNNTSTLPEYLYNNLGTPIELTMNTPTPYQYHSRVIEVYPHPGTSSNQSRPVFRIWSGQ